jgi:L-arabinose isomerase
VPSLRSGGSDREALREAARIEVALREFMSEGGFGAITDTFENLDGLKQLPGIAAQRLMADGYGFGAEGDWKTAVMVRLVKVMASGLPGGTSFMEDYTYHLDPAGPKVLGAHMLEVCPSISDKKVSCEIHPLSIGGRSDPVRLVFDAGAGPAMVVGSGGHGRPLPPRRQRDRPGPSGRADGQAARRSCGLAAAPQLQPPRRRAG